MPYKPRESIGLNLREALRSAGNSPAADPESSQAVNLVRALFALKPEGVSVEYKARESNGKNIRELVSVLPNSPEPSPEANVQHNMVKAMFGISYVTVEYRERESIGLNLARLMAANGVAAQEIGRSAFRKNLVRMLWALVDNYGLWQLQGAVNSTGTYQWQTFTAIGTDGFNGIMVADSLYLGALGGFHVPSLTQGESVRVTGTVKINQKGTDYFRMYMCRTPLLIQPGTNYLDLDSDGSFDVVLTAIYESYVLGFLAFVAGDDDGDVDVEVRNVTIRYL